MLPYIDSVFNPRLTDLRLVKNIFPHNVAHVVSYCLNSLFHVTPIFIDLRSNELHYRLTSFSASFQKQSRSHLVHKTAQSFDLTFAFFTLNGNDGASEFIEQILRLRWRNSVDLSCGKVLFLLSLHHLLLGSFGLRAVVALSTGCREVLVIRKRERVHLWLHLLNMFLRIVLCVLLRLCSEHVHGWCTEKDRAQVLVHCILRFTAYVLGNS